MVVGPHIKQLLSIAGPPLSRDAPSLPAEFQAWLGPMYVDLLEILIQRNGFYAYEGALHFFPAGETNFGLSIVQWNVESLWRNRYGSKLDQCIFFAEDAFAEQFTIRQGGVFRFNPETLEFDLMGESLDEWARTILEDYSTETGSSSVHAWEMIHGKLPDGYRLIPKTPFVLQGSYDPENLYASDPVAAMHFRAHLAEQIRDLPDGTTVELHIVD